MIALASAMRSGRISSSAALMMVFAIVFGLGRTLSAGSIFDDDWTPPTPEQSSSSSTPSTADSGSVTLERDAPNIRHTDSVPVAGGNSSDSSTTPPLERRPVPPKADQARSRSLMKDVYAKELADHSSSARKAFGQKLLSAATAASDNQVDQFVLLVGAMKAGEEGADLPVCIEAANQLGTIYSVNSATLIHDTAFRIRLKPGSPVDIGDSLRAGLELLDRLADTGDYVTGLRLIVQLQSLTANDAAGRVIVLDRKKEFDSLQAAQQKYNASLPALKASPNDPSANFAVGTYLCLIRGLWSDGLSMLAKVSDPAIKELGAHELKRPADPVAQLALADEWISAAKKFRTDAALMRGARRRGLSWYHLCAPNLSGLQKIGAQARFADPAAAELGPPMIMKYAGDAGDEKLFSLTDSTVPDELQVAQTIGKISISGVKKGDMVRINGHVAGHIGKAFAFSAKEAQGIATVGVSSVLDHSSYVIMVFDRKNVCSQQRADMQKGEAYIWKLTTVGSTAKLTVTGANGEIASVECADYKQFAIGTEGRYPGDAVDLTVLFQ